MTSQFMSGIYIFVRVLLHVDEHCHGGKVSISWSLVYSGCFFSILGSVSLIVIYSEQLLLFLPVSATRGIPYILDPTKYEASTF